MTVSYKHFKSELYFCVGNSELKRPNDWSIIVIGVRSYKEEGISSVIDIKIVFLYCKPVALITMRSYSFHCEIYERENSYIIHKPTGANPTEQISKNRPDHCDGDAIIMTS